MPRPFRVETVVVLILLSWVAPARADWLLIPFAGVRFGGTTALLDLESAAGERSYALGVSVAAIGGGVLGVEGDVGLVPGFFQRDDHPGPSITSSSVTSVSGNIVLMLPLSVTRESLRPYVVVGAGLLRARSVDQVDVFPIRSTMPAITLGVGAMGYFSDDTGVRFDVRLHRSLGQGDDELERPGHRLRFWRATLGIIRRF
jgi:hypothetical protein